MEIAPDIRKNLLKAADLVELRGLAKHTQLDVDGSLCIVGALSVAKSGEPYMSFRPESEIVAAYLKLDATNYSSGAVIADWNNDMARTKEEVVAALRGAAAL